MNKKEYKQPSVEVMKLEHASSILAGSDTETGYREGYQGDDEIETVTNTLWDR